MLRILYSFIVVLIVASALWFIHAQSVVSEDIFSQFQAEELTLTKAAVLYFPLIEAMAKLPYERIPEEIRALVPMDSSNIVSKEVVYKSKKSGYFIGGEVRIPNLENHRRAYGIQVTSNKWRTTSGAFREKNSIREIENENYQARVIFFNDSFGIFILKKNAQ